MKKKQKSKTFKVENHILVPIHKKLSESEKKKILEHYKISFRELPVITVTDVAIEYLDVKEGDVVKITRKSPTAGDTIFYRGVINV